MQLPGEVRFIWLYGGNSQSTVVAQLILLDCNSWLLFTKLTSVWGCSVSVLTAVHNTSTSIN